MQGADLAVEQALALPIKDRARALANLTEGQWFERKSIRLSPRTLAQIEVAFSNAEGGVIVIGLLAGDIEGIAGHEKAVNELTQAHLEHTEPPVSVRTERVKCIDESGQENQLLLIRVDSSERVHATRKDEAYIRVGDENRKLNFAQRQELLFDKGQATYDRTPVSNTSISDLDAERVANYATALRASDSARAIESRGLIVPKTGELTVAGYLLFGTMPQSQFPSAIVRVVKYRGVTTETGTRQNIEADERCEGPIPAVLSLAQSLVARLQPSNRALGVDGRFGPQPVIPESAWLEGIVNAVVHRSYSLGGDHIRVTIFDDRIEIESPGRFPGLTRVRDPRNTVRFARNPHIARVCSDLDYGQELGEGIRRIFEDMRGRGLNDPLYVETTASVRLTLLATAVGGERLSRGQLALLDLLRSHSFLGTGDIQVALGVARPTVLRYLRNLEERNLVERVAKSPTDPRASWRIKFV